MPGVSSHNFHNYHDHFLQYFTVAIVAGEHALCDRLLTHKAWCAAQSGSNSRYMHESVMLALCDTFAKDCQKVHKVINIKDVLFECESKCLH